MFCRVDGTRLITDSLTSDSTATAILHSAPVSGRTSTRSLQGTPSIAILPFANMSNDAEYEYFCDGLAEELLNALAKVENLKVAARTSAFSFKGSNTNVSEIGRVLNVNSVLEGSVRKSGDKLRITVQLINASDGYHLWSERYDRQMKDIFDVQDEITMAVVDALRVKLLGEDKAALLKRYTDNTEAYELYLKGRYFYNKYTAEDLQKGIEYFERAIKKEPEYAPAYAGIGFCYGALWYFGFFAPHEIMPKWRAVISRALEIDSDLADAHLSLASIHFYYEWNFTKAERSYQRAIVLNANSPDAHWRYGHFLAALERFEEAISEGRQALELDPLSLVTKFFMVRIYWFANRLDDALEQAQGMIEMEPSFPSAYVALGGVCLQKGLYEEAVKAYQQALTLHGFVGSALSYLGAVYGIMGKRDEAHNVLSQLLEMRKTQHVTAYRIACVYGGLGENDKAFEWLEKAVEEKNGEIVFLKREVEANIFDESIRQDPRFADLMRQVGLPQ
ncbi:MAG TPA: tetratricopeptide repeat protein [Pyrinomonadaceae bacterium]